MRTIWKWRLIDRDNPPDPLDRPTLKMPFGARVLCVETQNGETCVWAEVEDTEHLSERRFVIVGTGTERPSDAMRYIGTWQASGFVFHLYETP